MEDTYLIDEVNRQNIIVVLSTTNRKSVVPPPRAEFPIVGLPGRYLKVWTTNLNIENLNLFLLFLPLNNSSTSICFPFDQFFLHCKYTTATTLSFQDPSGKQQIFQAHTRKSWEVFIPRTHLMAYSWIIILFFPFVNPGAQTNSCCHRLQLIKVIFHCWSIVGMFQFCQMSISSPYSPIIKPLKFEPKHLLLLVAHRYLPPLNLPSYNLVKHQFLHLIHPSSS